MDSSSPEPTAKSGSPLSHPVGVEESPVFTYISNLSPIKPVKGAPAPQSFPELNSPPLVFTSPRINERSQSNFRERPQLGQLSSGGLSRQNKHTKDIVTLADESGISNTKSSSGLISCPKKAFVSNNSAPEKAGSSSACADDCLNNVNLEGSAYSSHSNLTPKSSVDIPRSVNLVPDSRKSVVIIEDTDDTRKHEMATGEPPSIFEQAEDNHQVKQPSDLKSVAADERPGDGDGPSTLCQKLEHSGDHAFNNQHGQQTRAVNAGCGHKVEVDCISQFGSLRTVQDQGSCDENTDALCMAVDDKMQPDQISKVGLYQHGIRRRCLQFEEALRKTTATNTDSSNVSGSAGFPWSPASPDDLQVLESSSMDKPATPCSGLLANMTQPAFSPQHSERYSMNVCKPSGIGLHLNSIVKDLHVGSGATVSLKSAERGSLSAPGKNSVSAANYFISKNCSSSLNMMEGISLSSEDRRHALIAGSSATSLSPYIVEPLNDSLILKPMEHQPYPCEKTKSDSENADIVDNSSPPSPKKRRKKTPDDGDTTGCKRCNCKKSKCLKLYCECFGAGIYCAEPCSCQGCFNRLEYEDTVLEARQQIEIRNPSAFHPKVVLLTTKPSANSCVDDRSSSTPFSARHKRGCNCKKSKCLKKYCECYQANVGCSDGCRCEGCENVYGRKGEYGVKDLVSKQGNEIPDSSFDKQLELVASRDSLLHNDLCDPHSLTPLTPSFQCSNHGKDASNSWFPSGRYLPSPESDLSFMAPYGTSPGSAINPDHNDMILETNNEIMQLVSFGQELNYGTGDTMNQFSPRCDGPRSTSHLPAMPNSQNWVNASKAQVFHGNHQISSASSLRWRSSPISQMPHFEGDMVDFDDTPEILRENPIPPNALKVRSPNKKRVSPPHVRGTELGSSSSAGLRTGRKFILQAVPSFPPLTPCIESKVSAGQDSNGPQNCNISK